MYIYIYIIQIRWPFSNQHLAGAEVQGVSWPRPLLGLQQRAVHLTEQMLAASGCRWFDIILPRKESNFTWCCLQKLGFLDIPIPYHMVSIYGIGFIVTYMFTSPVPLWSPSVVPVLGPPLFWSVWGTHSKFFVNCNVVPSGFATPASWTQNTVLGWCLWCSKPSLLFLYILVYACRCCIYLYESAGCLWSTMIQRHLTQSPMD